MVASKRIIFFVKSFNDFDNILPVIYFLSKNYSDHSIKVFSLVEDMSDFKYQADYCMNSLNISVDYLFYGDKSVINFMLDFLMKVSRKLSIKKNKTYFIPLLLLNGRLKYIIQLLSNIVINRLLFLTDRESIIMIDFGNELSILGHSLVRLANSKKIPIIGYLHGYSIYLNKDTLTLDKSNIGYVKKTIIRFSKHNKKRLYCDCYLVGPSQKETFFKSGQMPNFSEKKFNRVNEIGIPRYAVEWIDIYRKNVIKDSDFYYGDRNKLNVCMFLSHPKYNVDLKSLYNLIHKISLIENVNFVIKPHTRNNFNGLNKEKMIAYDASNISSVLLSQWSDVGIVYGSSIAIQLLIDHVPVILPSFVDKNYTILQHMNVCTDLRNVQETINLLNRLDKNNVDTLINSKCVDRFIRKIVYGEKKYDKLMNNFCESILECKSANHNWVC
jgi:hypothetical protein